MYMFNKLRKKFKGWANKQIEIYVNETTTHKKINDYQWGSLDMVNTHLTKKDIEELSYIWSTESKEIIDNINNHPNGYIYISQENLKLLLNKLYDNTQDLSVFTANHLDSDYH